MKSVIGRSKTSVANESNPNIVEIGAVTMWENINAIIAFMK